MPPRERLRLRAEIREGIGDLIDLRVEDAETGEDLGPLAVFSVSRSHAYASEARVQVEVPAIAVRFEEVEQR